MATNLLNAIKDDRIIIGTNSVLKLAKANELNEIYLAANCPDKIKNKIELLSKLSKISAIILKESNEELAALCKKPFLVSVVGVKAKKE